MLKDWLEKLKSIFRTEDEIEQVEDIPQRGRDVKAKMTYQYPEPKPFRFPIIPDERTLPKNEIKKQNDEQRKEEKRTVKKGKSSNETWPRKVERDEKAPPFKVTEVPSPIYGFQKRKEDLEEVPAFIRKGEENKAKALRSFEKEDVHVVLNTSRLEETAQEEAAGIEMEQASKTENITEMRDLTIMHGHDEGSTGIELEIEQAYEGNTGLEETTVNKEVVEAQSFVGQDSGNEETKDSDVEQRTEIGPEIHEEPLEEENGVAETKGRGEREEAPEVETEHGETNSIAQTVQETIALEDRTQISQTAGEEKTKHQVHKPPSPMKAKKQRKDKGRKGHQSQIPFNVIMTPSDKRRLQQNQERPSISNKPPSEMKTVRTGTDEEPKTLKAPTYLLNDPEVEDHGNDYWIEEQQELLEQTLKHFHVNAKVVRATQGPSVTRFEVQPELGVKVSKIRNLSDDLKLNMSAKDIRIEAPIPGKNTVGIEVPNPQAQMVGLQEIIETEEFKQNKSPLTIALGLTIEGEPKITNIQKMPHGLIAGATGSGKSVCINTILVSMLYKASHEDVKFLLIDPKMVELAPYNGIPHLVAPVITDVKAATQSLKWAVNEMEERYERFVEEGVRDIERFNRKVLSQGRKEDKMPYIVIVIDELADLMMMSPQDVENAISRIAQKARACGIHLLLATQRPSVDVITGLIKANIPTRIAFSVSSQVDSRTILDASGAEKLLGKGDMLFMENGTGKSIRLQGPFVSDEEIDRVTAYARDIAEPDYLFEQEQLLEQIHLEEDEDELLEDAIAFVIRQQTASTSMLQRHFKIGYNRAARLIDSLEARGIISGQNGSKPRDVLVSEATVEQEY